MSSFKHQFFSTFPHEERDAVEKMLARSVTHENDPVFFFLYQSRLAYLATKQAAQDYPDAFLQSLGKHLAEARELRNEIGGRGVWRKLVVSRVLTGIFSTVITLALCLAGFFYINQQERLQMWQLKQANEAILASQTQEQANIEKLIANQGRIHDAQVGISKEIGTSLNHIEKIVSSSRGLVSAAGDQALAKIQDATKATTTLDGLMQILQIPGVGLYREKGDWAMILPKAAVDIRPVFKDGAESSQLNLIFHTQLKRPHP